MRNVSTTDICLAGTLKLHGYNLDLITKEGNRGTFIFSDIPDEVIRDYDLGKALVEPATFNSCIRMLSIAIRRLP